MNRSQLAEHLLARYEDLEFGAARAWLDAAPGRKAVGYLPVYAPREIIHAAGMLPVGVHGGGGMEIIRGDAYYQSYICHLPRSVIELALSGRLGFLSGVLFPSTCDVIRNLSGMWQVLLPQMYVKYLDLPQIDRPELASAFWQKELRTLMHDLGGLSGKAVTEDALRQSLAVYNEARALVVQLYRVRRERPWQFTSEELYLLLRAAETMAVEDFLVLGRQFLAVTETEPGRPRDNSRVIVVGAFCEQPPLGLIKTIERAGCAIVDDDFLLGNRLVSGDVSLDGDPVAALADGLVNTAVETSILYEGDPQAKRSSIRRRAQAAGADGVIFAAPSFCDPALLDRPMLRAGAEADGIPCIAFNYSENTAQFQQFREQAGTFSDAIKLWGGA